MHTKRFLATLLTLAMVLGLMPAALAAEPAAETTSLKSQIVTNVSDAETADPEAWVTVVVELKDGTTLDEAGYAELYRTASQDYAASEEVAAYRNDMVAAQEAVQAKIAQINPEAQFRYHYTNLINGFAAKVQLKDIAAIEALDEVASVFQTQTYSSLNNIEVEDEDVEYIALDEYYAIYGGDGIDLTEAVTSDAGSIDQMGLQTAWDEGYTGAGKVAGIFDSSLRYTHELFSYMDPDIAEKQPDNYKTKANLLKIIEENWDTINLSDSGWGSWFHGRSDDETGFSEDVQKAILNGDFWYNEKVPFTVDYMDGDLEVWDGDSSSHGTHVAGIVAGNAGPLDEKEAVSFENTNGVLGAAYDAQIMFFKVFSEYDDFGQESDEAVFAALDDAVTLGVNSFNLSLGIPNGFTTMNTYAQRGYQLAYNRAAAAGISIAVSAGNDARDNHPGAQVNGYTTVLPNSSKVGFSGSLMGPMTVASAQGTGYKYVTHYEYDTVKFVDADGKAVEGLSTAKGVQIYDKPLSATLTGSYEVVDCGDGSEEAILAATGADGLADALDGKIALVNRTYGYLPYDDNGIVIAQENAYKAGAAAVIACFTYYNNYFGSGSLWTGADGEYVPVSGAFTKAAVYDPVVTYLAGDDAKLFVTFGTDEADITTERTYGDNGPSGFTSWGVTEALKLKPDIMTPGGNILSAGAASDTALSVKSGTSMASPNMAGAFLLVQQYVDANLETFGVEKGTQEYTNLVNQLVASTAKVYTAGESGLYFTPRRQGAGMADIAAVINSKVVLYNGVEYDPVTGEASRTKVELYDQLGDTFEFTFYLKNYNDEERVFDVLACLQTDATTKDDDDRKILVGVKSDGTDIDAIEDAVMTISEVTDGATINTNSENINRYNAGATAAKITVAPKTEVAITVTVDMSNVDLDTYDEIYPNGMFLEGYVFFDSDKEDVNIPFMGFRGDWTAAPIFDLATAYDDISAMDKTDNEYPLFYTTTLNAVVEYQDGAATEIVLGANNFDETAWPGYNYTSAAGVTKIRNYLDAQRENGFFHADFASFSPNGDKYADFVYADLALLRNAKALCVVITDEDGNIVKTIGPEYEYFETLSSDGNGTQQVAATYGTKYKRNMQWDGTDEDGNVVADGQYTYTVYAMTEYEYNNCGLQPVSNNAQPDAAKVLNALLTSETADSVSMAVKVDTTAPVIDHTLLAVNDEGDMIWWVDVTDTTGIQALGWLYDGELSELQLISDHDRTKYGWVFDEGTDVSKMCVVAVDYAGNESEAVFAPAVYVTPDCANVFVGDWVTFTAAPVDANSAADIAYQWYSVDEDGQKTLIEGATNASYKFLPSTDGEFVFVCVATIGEAKYENLVVVTAEYEDDDDNTPVAPSTPTTPSTPSNPSTPATPTTPAEPETPSFTDLPKDHWAAGDVDKLVEKGLITGTGDGTTFSPADSTTRAMGFTIIYRMAGSPDISASSSAWYAKAMQWAFQQGILTGYADGSFGENDLITREQLAVILYRYAKPTASSGDLSAFADADSVSDWAVEAMTWAVSQGLITGKPGNLLDPQGYASRAEFTVILSRFIGE